MVTPMITDYDAAALALAPDASDIADISLELGDVVSVDTGNIAIPFVGRVMSIKADGSQMTVRHGSVSYRTQPGQPVALLLKADAYDALRRLTAQQVEAMCAVR